MASARAVLTVFPQLTLSLMRQQQDTNRTESQLLSFVFLMVLVMKREEQVCELRCTTRGQVSSRTRPRDQFRVCAGDKAGALTWKSEFCTA